MSSRSTGTKQKQRLEGFLAEVLLYARGSLEPGTAEIYRNTFRHFAQLTGDIPLGLLTARHFDRYKIDRLARVRPATVNIELRTLKATFRIAVRWNMLRRSPMDGVKLAREAEREPAYFSREDFRRLLDAITEPWFRDVVLFAAATGMRQGEILSLGWDQIDFSRNVARIESSPSFKTKSGKRRTVPLSGTAVEVLRSRECSGTTGVVFTLRGRPMLRRWVTTKLRRYVRALGMDPRLNFHSIRHSFASWLALDGVSIYQISKILGHSDVKITQHYYAHLQPDELHGVVERIRFG